MILVASREGAERAVNGAYRIDALISVRDGPADPAVDHAFAAAHPRALLLAFDDVSSDWFDIRAPRAEQIAAALDFAKNVRDDESLMVHCAAGVSRSAGIVLGVFAARTRDVQASLELLDAAVEHTHALGFRARARDHHPNAKVVLHCDRILSLNGTLVAGYCKRFGVLRTQFWRQVGEEPG